jgi:hypothetical protein
LEVKELKKLKLTMGDYAVCAKLHVDKVPKHIAAIEKNLPALGYVRHAKICDNEWMLPVPFAIDVDEPDNKIRPVPGDIGYNRAGQFFCGWYAEMAPLGFTNLIASVEKTDLPEYEKQMKTIWLKPGAQIKVEIVEV